GQPPHVINMHMGDNQRLDAGQRKLDSHVGRVSALLRNLSPLKKTAIDQHTAVGSQVQLMTTASYPIDGTVMFYLWISHGLSLPALLADCAMNRGCQGVTSWQYDSLVAKGPANSSRVVDVRRPVRGPRGRSAADVRRSEEEPSPQSNFHV